jgi:hypothetical protein
MNTQQRMDYILNNTKYIQRYMAIHDAEVKQRKQTKLKGFLSWLKK